MRYHKVRELEDPELLYVTLLELYMPWRNEEDLKRDCFIYAEKFKFVKDDIMRNIKKQDAFYGKFDLNYLLDERLDGIEHDLLDEDEKDNGTSDYGMLNLDLLKLNSDEQGGPSEPSTGPVVSQFVKNESLRPTAFYRMCSLLNEEQQKLFIFTMRYSWELQLNKRSNLEPNPFYPFLSGGVGDEDSFLTKLITEYSQTCIRRPLFGPLKSGRFGQVVVL